MNGELKPSKLKTRISLVILFKIHPLYLTSLVGGVPCRRQARRELPENASAFPIIIHYERFGKA
jgi:hypothetical protein